jgi:hypothetical protein
MKAQFEIQKATRNNLLKTIDGLDIEQINKIPSGFKNTIGWNFAHILVTQQLLVYGLSGNTMLLDQTIIDTYRKGTSADTEMSNETLSTLKIEALVLADKMEEDYNNSVFTEYKEYPTSYNFTLGSIEDAIAFNNLHEGLHFGYIMAMKKMV